MNFKDFFDYCEKLEVLLNKTPVEYSISDYRTLCEISSIYDIFYSKKIGKLLRKKRHAVYSSGMLKLSEESDYCPNNENMLSRSNEITIGIRRIRPTAIIPTYGTTFSAGADLYACLENDKGMIISPGQTQMIATGISIKIPIDMVGLIYARSGLSCKRGLAPANKVGVIDADYRGEIMVALHNHSTEEVEIHDRDRIAQLVITTCYHTNFIEEDTLDKTERGEGGFGSTGN